MERSFAESKELHGLRDCLMRGNEIVSEQRLLTAAVQNMKRTANILWKRDFYFLSAWIKNLICMTKPTWNGGFVSCLRASDAACSAKINVVIILLQVLCLIAPNNAEKCGNRAYG